MALLANVPLRARLPGAFGIVLTVLIILASAAYRTTTLNQDATAAVAHTFQVIGTANTVLANLIDMETGYRGFLLSGDDSFLEPYQRGSADIDDQLAVLQTLTADNPDQVVRWRTVEERLNLWRQAVTEPGIALRREVTAGRATLEDLNAWVSTGEGRRRFNSVRAVFGEAIAVEQALLTDRQAEASAAGERLQIVLIGGTILATGLSVVLAYLLTGGIVGPVRRFATTAGEIASGHLDRRIGLQQRDEIGVAAASFDRMADRLQSTIARSEAILDTAAEGIVGLDRTGRITFANPAAAAMIGLPEEQIVGQDAIAWNEHSEQPSPPGPLSLCAGEGEIMLPSPTVGRGMSAQPMVAPRSGGGEGFLPIAAVLESGVVERGAGDLLRPNDGGRLPIEYACAPLKDADTVLGAVLTFRDIAERLANQQALEDRARELARSNADLEQFAYVASHDLQEPLRAVVSYLQLLERRYKAQLDERAERYIGHAVEGGHRMQALINDLLTYSRVGRRGEELTPVDTDVVLARVLASLQVAIEESGATITHDPLPTVVADPTQFLQLLQNLVGNAIKFRGEQPSQVHVAAERRESDWLFSVRDNGIGIAPEYRDRVFVLFQRLHGRDEYTGTGIGLAVCKKIVEQHGGDLWVDETPGGGSTFWFTIPAPGGTPS